MKRALYELHEAVVSDMTSCGDGFGSWTLMTLWIRSLHLKRSTFRAGMELHLFTPKLNLAHTVFRGLVGREGLEYCGNKKEKLKIGRKRVNKHHSR